MNIRSHKIYSHFTARLLKSNWGMWRSAIAMIPLGVVVIIAGVSAHFAKPPHRIVGNSGIVLTLVFLLIEIGVLLRASLRYLVKHMFAPPKEHAARLLERLPNCEKMMERLSQKPSTTDDEINSVVNLMLHQRKIGAEAIERMTILPVIVLRILADFTLATTGLIWWAYLREACHTAANQLFFGIAYEPNGLMSVFRLLERSVYLNLVTISTVGFGDHFPRYLCARLMIDAEIATTIFGFTFCTNVLVGILMENSGWAWEARRESLQRYLKSFLQEHRIARSSLSTVAIAKPAEATVASGLPPPTGQTHGCTLIAERLEAHYLKDGKKISVLNGFSCAFRSGQITVVMGRNGCGKSTLLKGLAGEIALSAGHLRFDCDGQQQPDLEYMPQDYRQALFPWKLVHNNIRPWEPSPPIEREKALLEEDSALNLFGLTRVARSYPYSLSGGQQQMVLLARCLTAHTRVILLDEPFSALDVIRRASVAEYLRTQWRNSGKIVICIMHEPDEACVLADEVLLCTGPPLRLTERIIREGDALSGEAITSFRAKIERGIHQAALEE